MLVDGLDEQTKKAGGPAAVVPRRSHASAIDFSIRLAHYCKKEDQYEAKMAFQLRSASYSSEKVIGGTTICSTFQPWVPDMALVVGVSCWSWERALTAHFQ